MELSRREINSHWDPPPSSRPMALRHVRTLDHQSSPMQPPIGGRRRHLHPRSNLDWLGSHAPPAVHMVLRVREPDDHTAQQPTETLQVGPSRPTLFQKVPTEWRQHAVAFLAFVLGVAAGGGAVLWRQARPAPPPFRVDEHAVELILFKAVPPRTHPRGWESEISPMQVNSALLLSGAVTSTVLTINNPDHSLDVRAPALPLTVSPTARFQSVNLKIMVRDCKAATRWTPVDRPFTITWRDEYGMGHLDRAGDFDRSIASSLIRYIDAVCGDPLNR